MGSAFALAALVLFATNAFIVRAAAHRLEQGLGFLVVLGANVVFAGLLSVGSVLVRGGVSPVDGEPWVAVGLFLLAGIAATYLGRRGYFKAVELMGPSRAAAVQNTTPMFAALFAFVLLGERLSLLDLTAMVVIVGGLLLTSQVPSAGEPGRARMTRMPLRVLGPAVVAAACYALGNVARGGAVDMWDEAIIGGFLGALSGTAAYILFHVSVPALVAEVRAADRRGLVLWALAGFTTIAGQICVIAATVHIPVAVAVAISSATPVLIIPVSVLVLRNAESIRLRTAAGALLIVGGVVALMLR